jgi:hypothetical protein
LIKLDRPVAWLTRCARSLLLLAAIVSLFSAQAIDRGTIRVSTAALADAELSRAALPAPGITARAGVASPTRAPWIVANGWRFMRQPGAKYRYEVPAGQAALAAAEAFAYGADALLKIDPADEATVAALLAFFASLPPSGLPPIADVGLVDDETAAAGEVMNLLARRNLLYEIVKAPSTRHRITITLGTREFPAEEAADPNAFALKVRRLLTDEQRALRIYGSEVVIARLTGDSTRVRLHLINYGGRDIEGLRVRLRGAYAAGDAYVPGTGRAALQDHAVAGGATEFSLPRFSVYAAIDLRAAAARIPNP